MIEPADARFERLFREAYPRVLAYVLRRTTDRALAEEVAAEVFLIAWRRFEKIGDEPVPWLLATARKVLANHWRAVKARPPAALAEQADRAAVGADLADQLADRQLLARAFSQLADKDREALALVAWDGLDPGEAAIVVGVTAPVFSVRLHRARRRLKKILEGLETG